MKGSPRTYIHTHANTRTYAISQGQRRVKERILDEDNGAKSEAANEGRGAKGAAHKRPAQMDEQAAQRLTEVCFCMHLYVYVVHLYVYV
jgi:hypothetical protein